MKLLLLTLLIWNLASATTTQELFSKALKATEQYHLKFKNFDLEFQSAQLEVSSLGKNFLPTFSLEASSFMSSDVRRQKSGLDRFDSQLSLRLEQDLFRGGAEWTYFSLKKTIPNLQSAINKVERREIFYLVNQRLFATLALMSERKILAEQIEALRKRVGSIRERVKIGRNRKADLLVAQAQLKRLEARAINLQEQLGLSRAELETLTGPIELELPDLQMSPFLSLPKTWNALGENDVRLDVLEQQKLLAEDQVRIERANYYPTVSLAANLYLERASRSRSDDWDVSVNASWPFFEFGRTQDSVARARVEYRQVENNLIQGRRDRFIDWKARQEAYAAKVEALNALKEAFDLSKEYYREHVKEFGQGLISSIELTRALDDFIEAEKTYDNAQYELIQSWHELKLYVGEFE